MTGVRWLAEQHALDLAVYRSAHEHDWNRRLHYVLIPFEVASFLWIATTLLMILTAGGLRSFRNQEEESKTWHSRPAIVFLTSALAWTLGILSCAVATNKHLGLAVLILHVVLDQLCQYWIPVIGYGRSLIVGSTVWMLSWTLQIGLGHYWMEGKPPNIFNPNDNVSWLSAATSIVLAWEC